MYQNETKHKRQTYKDKNTKRKLTYNEILRDIINRRMKMLMNEPEDSIPVCFFP